MTIQWLGRACFRLEHDGYSIVIDPYNTSLTGYPPLSVSADMVLISHDHPGHNNAAAVKLSGTTRPCPFEIERVVVGHDEANGVLRGMNTIHILLCDGLKIVHLGDVGFATEDGRLMLPDVLMTGCGSFRTLPSYVMHDMAENLGANVVIPMHQHHGRYGNRRICTAEEFAAHFEGERDIIEYPTDTIEITRDMPRQVAMLRYMERK